jgi:hypothetical protein
MIQHLGFDAEKMVPVEEAYRMHDQPGSSCVPPSMPETLQELLADYENRDFGSCSYITPGMQAMLEIKATDLPH